MATNPNPTRITAEMWRFWELFKQIEPTVQLGGIYANKPGYHNFRTALPSTDYSVQLTADKLGPGDKAAAIDLTFPSAQAGNYAIINKYSGRLIHSGRDLNDMRGNYLREFFGNTNGDTVVDGWDFQYVTYSSSDSSHLWHIHLSFLRQHLNNRVAFDAVLSILRGETWIAYKARLAAAALPPPPLQPPVPPVVGAVLVQEVGDPAVYLSNNVSYQHVVNMTQLRQIQANLKAHGQYFKVVQIPKGNLAAGYFGKKA